MRTLELALPIKAYSVNSLFYRDGRRKKREAVEWEQRIIELLRNKETQKDIKDFKKCFDYNTDYIEAKLTFYYPKKDILTKDNRLSSKAFDITNVEKTIIDVLCDKKYATPTTENLDINDKYIKKCESEKHYFQTHVIYIKLEIKKLEDCLHSYPDKVLSLSFDT